MEKIAIVVQNSNKDVTVVDTINAIKENNFKNVFLQWYNKDWKTPKEEQLKSVRELGLNVIFAHLEYKKINEVWKNGDLGDEVVQNYKRDIKICKDNGIDLVVMHVIGSRQTPELSEIGLNRIKEIVKYAKEIGVRIAFENTRPRGYLEYILENIKDENVGMCFDIGHFHAYYDDEFDFELVKNRIFALHLHDNNGKDDQHLLPFDGNVKWEETIKKIVEANFTGYITMESCYDDLYKDISLKEFYNKAYERGKQLSEIFNKY